MEDESSNCSVIKSYYVHNQQQTENCLNGCSLLRSKVGFIADTIDVLLILDDLVQSITDTENPTNNSISMALDTCDDVTNGTQTTIETKQSGSTYIKASNGVEQNVAAILKSHIAIDTDLNDYTVSTKRVSSFKSDCKQSKDYFVCEECGKYFPKLSLLKMHQQRFHCVVKSYNCGYCGKKFYTSSCLRRHRRTHYNYKSLCVCEKCGKKFTKAGNLQKHLSFVHSRVKQHKCHICQKEFFESSALKDHLRVHSNERPFQCEICDKSFFKVGTLRSHLRSHTGEKYFCSSCQVTFTSQVRLKNHICVINVKRNPETNLLKSRTDDKRKKPFICEVCGKEFAVNQYLRKHCQVVHKVSSKIHAVTKVKTLKKKNCTKDKSLCTLCGKSFSGRGSLRKHIDYMHNLRDTILNKETPLKPNKGDDLLQHGIPLPLNHNFTVPSQQLDNDFSSQTSTNEPLSFINKTQRIRQCGICNEQFSDTNSLLSHSNRHADQKLFLCGICEARFSINDDLLYHFNFHSDTDIYSCKFCGETTFGREMKEHLGTVHSTAFYQCPLCNKTFARQIYILAHIRVVHLGERGYNCDMCDRVFTNSTNLKNHRRIHTGEKPFTCEICSKSFSQSVKLREHNRVHTREKPYTCEICSRGFSFNCNLKAHILTHKKRTTS